MSDTAIRIRLARSEEAGLVHRLMQEAFAEYAGVLLPPSGAHTETVADVAAAMTLGGAVIAWLKHDAVGSARFILKPDCMYVERVSVLPGQRGRGIAVQMMEFIETYASQLGRQTIEVGVRQSLPRNVALYRKLGYDVTKIEPHPRGPDYSITMIKIVKRAGLAGRPVL